MRSSYSHEFVESLPESAQMVDGVVYVSVEYDVAAHRCMCGCGSEVVTPFSPARWTMSYDGRCVSLHPSVGNWGSECESHYWLRSGQVIWSRHFSQDEIAFIRRKDVADLADGYSDDSGTPWPEEPDSESAVFGRFIRSLRRLFRS